MATVHLTCPQCNADLPMDSTREFGFCKYCGTKIMIREQMVTIINNLNNDQIVNETYNGNINVTNNVELFFGHSWGDWTGIENVIPDPEFGIYQGPLKNGKPHGVGKFIWRSGVVYEGSFEEGFIQGIGKKIWPRNQTYEGPFVDNYPEGMGRAYGTEEGGSDWEYVGMFHKGQYEGKGTMTWASGEKYVGDFHEGEFSGIGCYTTPECETFGEWKNGDMHGEIRRIWIHPDSFHPYKYEGYAEDGKWQGMGISYYLNRVIFVTQYNRGEYGGPSYIFYRDTRKIWWGRYKDNSFTDRVGCARVLPNYIFKFNRIKKALEEHDANGNMVTEADNASFLLESYASDSASAPRAGKHIVAVHAERYFREPIFVRFPESSKGHFVHPGMMYEFAVDEPNGTLEIEYLNYISRHTVSFENDPTYMVIAPKGLFPGKFCKVEKLG